MLISSNFASQTRWWSIFALDIQMHQAAPRQGEDKEGLEKSYCTGQLTIVCERRKK